MMIMLSWIFPVASGCRPIAVIAPLPMPPRPMPDPIAAMPMPIGSPRPSAAWKSIAIPPWLVGVLHFPLVLRFVVRQDEGGAEDARDREHDGLERAGQERQD